MLKSGENPTFDYYIAPRLGSGASRIINICDRASRDEQLESGDFVLVCRYLNWHWARRLASARGLAGLGLMFDDDFVAFFADRTVPLLYRLDVARRTLVPLRMVAKSLTDVFVSTALLKERYVNAQATVLRPAPAAADMSPRAESRSDRIRIAFHAQLSHLTDHRLAAQILSEITSRRDNLVIDVIGPPQARRHWQSIPRAQFRNEIDWPSYRRHSAETGADILIAPIFDTPLNQARAPTKAIDAVRMGAAGLFPALAPYRDLAGATPLVAGGAEQWVSAILHLLDDAPARRANAAALRRVVADWQQHANPIVAA